MTILKLKSNHPESIKRIIQSALVERLQGINEGIKRTSSRLKEFEQKYNLSTSEFVSKFNNNELGHCFDFDEWIGESKMLIHLQETKTKIEELEFVN